MNKLQKKGLEEIFELLNSARTEYHTFCENVANGDIELTNNCSYDTYHPAGRLIALLSKAQDWTLAIKDGDK